MLPRSDQCDCRHGEHDAGQLQATQPLVQDDRGQHDRHDRVHRREDRRHIDSPELRRKREAGHAAQVQRGDEDENGREQTRRPDLVTGARHEDEHRGDRRNSTEREGGEHGSALDLAHREERGPDSDAGDQRDADAGPRTPRLGWRPADEADAGNAGGHAHELERARRADDDDGDEHRNGRPEDCEDRCDDTDPTGREAVVEGRQRDRAERAPGEAPDGVVQVG